MLSGALSELTAFGRAKYRRWLCGKHTGDVLDGSQGGAFDTAFQHADVALGVAEGLSHLQLAPTAVQTKFCELGTERLGECTRFPTLVCANLFGHTASLLLDP